MAKPSVSGVLKKYWVVVVIVVALFSAGVVVGRLRTFFDSDQPLAPDSGHADAIVPFNTKRVTYEIFGPPGTSGRVSYLDDKGRTHEESFSDLPWSATVSTTDPGLLANVVAQSLRGGERFTATFDAEDTDFVRLNRGKVRQPGTVTQPLRLATSAPLLPRVTARSFAPPLSRLSAAFSG